MSNLSTDLGSLLTAKAWRLAVAESCTGGLLASEVTAVAGSSDYFDCGVVTYSNAAKHELLGVSWETLDAYGAVSSQTARAMVLGVLTHSPAQLALSITGIAGPSGGSDTKPVGFVCFGLAHRMGDVATREYYFSGDRTRIREQAVSFALQWAVDYLKDASIALL